MPTVKLSPVFNGQTETSTGAPASGYKLYTYAAGSSTLQATYTDSTGSTAQANPIVLNSLGFADNTIWLQSGLSYKFVLTDAAGVTIKTIDNVSGINDTTTSVSQWQSSGLTPTYVSASSFTLSGDQTTEFHVGRRLQFTVTAGTVYGTIKTTAYTTLTTVTMDMDSSSLDSGLSVVNLSLNRADNPALPVIPSVNIASAATTSLIPAKGRAAHITGTTGISAFTMAKNQVVDLIFDDALTLTHNATTNNLPGGANITTAAGDRARYFYDGTTVYCLSFVSKDGYYSKTQSDARFLKLGESAFFAKQSTGQSISANTTTTVLFQTEDFDLLNEYDPAKGIFTAANAGTYEFGAQVIGTQNSTAPTWNLSLAIGGTASHMLSYNGNAISGLNSLWMNRGTVIMQLAAGNQVSVQYTTSVADTLNSNGRNTNFWGKRIG